MTRKKKNKRRKKNRNCQNYYKFVFFSDTHIRRRPILTNGHIKMFIRSLQYKIVFSSLSRTAKYYNSTTISKSIINYNHQRITFPLKANSKSLNFFIFYLAVSLCGLIGFVCYFFYRTVQYRYHKHCEYFNCHTAKNRNRHGNHYIGSSAG